MLNNDVLGLCGKVLVVGRLQGWLLRETARSFPYVQETMPADLRVDPLLAKAEPISNGGSTSRVT